jgi:hypothetical protein
LVLLVACGGGLGTVTCPPAETRNKMDCDLGFATDSRNIQGSLSFLSIGGTANTSVSAVRQVSDTLMQFAFKRQDICLRWNACTIDQTQFNLRADGYADALGGVVTQKDALNNPATADGAFQSISRFQLSFSATVSLPQDVSTVPDVPCNLPDDQRFALQAPKILEAGDPVPSGSHITFTVQTSEPIYLYLFQRLLSNNDVPDVIFPMQGIKVHNPIPANTPVTIPDPPKDYCLNEKDIGVEKVFIVASRKPLQNMDDAIEQITSKKATTIDGAGDAIQSMDDIPADPTKPAPACVSDTKSRGLVLDGAASGAPKTGCTKSRGLVLDSVGASQAKQPASFTAVSEAGADGMVVKIFPYNHVKPSDYAAAATAANPPDVGTGQPRKRDIMIEE